MPYRCVVQSPPSQVNPLMLKSILPGVVQKGGGSTKKKKKGMGLPLKFKHGPYPDMQPGWKIGRKWWTESAFPQPLF